ncbi:MAG: hypothetical protein ACTHOF_05990 [Flavisolibacter sp.]
MEFYTNKKQKNGLQNLATRWAFSHFRSLCALVALSLVSFNLRAQISIDGHASDWANKTYNAYSHDANNSNDDQFTQGSKDGDAINSWHWSVGQTNNKGDITNAAAILGTENGHNIIYFAGDRAVNNGDAAIGFWFFKTGVTKNANGTFTGTHSNGDLLIVSHFTQGGGQADIFVYVFNNGALTGPTKSSNAAVNSAVETVPAGFSYASASYPVGDFFEGKVDLTALNIPPCFANFLLETRNSQSITASLQDLTFGSFTTSVDPPGTTGDARCGTGVVNLSASGCPGGTLKWFDAQTGGTQVNTGATYAPTISATTTYWVSCTTADGCVSARSSVTGTINENPTVTASATPAGNVNIGSAPPHYQLGSTVNGTANNTGYNYAWVQDPPVGNTTGTLSDATLPDPTFTAKIAGTFKWTVTATDKVTGCFSSADVTRTVDPVAGCPNVPRDPVCSGTTHTYTADATPAASETWTWSVDNGATINASPANGGQSISVTAGTQSFTLKLTKKFANTALSDQVCNYPVTVNPLDPAPDVTYNAPGCTDNSFSVTVNSPSVGSTYTLTQLDGNTVTTSPYVSGPLVITGLHIGQGFSIFSTTSAGCKSSPFDCGTFDHTTSRMVQAKVQLNEVIEQPTVIAAPNPFSDRIKFSIRSPLAGQGSLELYNMLGQKITTVYQGRIEKGTQNFEYAVPGPQRANLIYLFRIGNYKTTGKLIGLK